MHLPHPSPPLLPLLALLLLLLNLTPSLALSNILDPDPDLNPMNTSTTSASQTTPASPITPTCPVTIYTFHPFNFGPTKTVDVVTVTSTVSVDCGGCTSVVVRNGGGHGPVIPPFSATITETATATVETYVCGGATPYVIPMVE